MCWNLPMRCGHKMVMQLGWLQIFWNQPGYLNWEKMIKQVCEGQLWDQRLRGGLKGAFARSAPGSSCCLPRAAGWDAESSVTSHLPEATGQGGPYYWSARRDTGIKKKKKTFLVQLRNRGRWYCSSTHHAEDKLCKNVQKQQNDQRSLPI